MNLEKDRWAREINPFAILLAGVNEDLENRTEDELKVLLEACERPTTTNCWVWTYRAADWVKPLVVAELERRGA